MPQNMTHEEIKGHIKRRSLDKQIEEVIERRRSNADNWLSTKEAKTRLDKLYKDIHIIEYHTLLSLIDGASVIVELWEAKTPGQKQWQKSWLKRAEEKILKG